MYVCSIVCHGNSVLNVQVWVSNCVVVVGVDVLVHILQMDLLV